MDFRIFGVIAQQRSGTHYLEGLLNAHPSIRSFGEVINARHSTYNFYRYLGQATAADPDVIRPHGWGPTWNTFVEELAGGKEGMIGVILMYNQLALLPPHFQEKVLARVRPIHLIRRNVLRTHVSDAINNLKQKPVHSKDIEGELIRIELTIDTLLFNLTRRQATIEAMRARLAGRKHLEVIYEALIAHEQGEIARVFAFLELRKADVSTRLKRSNPYRLSEILTNYDAVAATLRGTEFESMVEA